MCSELVLVYVAVTLLLVAELVTGNAELQRPTFDTTCYACSEELYMTDATQTADRNRTVLDWCEPKQIVSCSR